MLKQSQELFLKILLGFSLKVKFEHLFPTILLLSNPSKTFPLNVPQNPDFEPELNVPQNPNPQTKIRTTTSTPSSPIPEEPEEGNLIPRHRRSTRNDGQEIRRTFQEGESSCAGAKTVLRTSSGDEFDYLPDDVVAENRLAYQQWQQQQAQDQKDLNATLKIAIEDGNSENPISSQASVLDQIKNDRLAKKNEDFQWCSKKI